MKFPGLSGNAVEFLLGQLGFAGEQVKSIDAETKRLFIALMVKAVASGNANAYLKVRLQYLSKAGDDYDGAGDTAPAPPPRPEPRVEVVDREERPSSEGSRWRRKSP
jgi:hypothetical protein